MFLQFFRHKLRDRHGFTLIEIMAAIALLAVIVTLSSRMLTQSDNSHDNVQAYNHLQQQTNQIVTDISRTYHSKTGTGDLAFSEGDGGVSVRSITINGNAKGPESPIEHVDFDQPMHLQIVVQNENGQTTTVQTSRSPKENRHITID